MTSITDLEQSTGQRLKRIVLIVDEFAILTTDTTRMNKRTVGTWSKLLMTRIASLGRSSGVSICIALAERDAPKAKGKPKQAKKGESSQHQLV